MFFITCFRDIGLDEFERLEIGASRTFGFTDTFEKAEHYLNNNTCDMYERFYRYAFVEEMYPAIHPVVENRWFYVWNNERNGFFRQEEPEVFRHYCNFALG